MSSATAAAYCGEPSVDAFLDKVRRQIYPEALKQPGCEPKWHKAKLDRNIALRHGLIAPSVDLPEDLTDLI